MARDGLIDYPNYDPDAKVVFPPTGPATDDRDTWNRERERANRKDYADNYDPDPRAANPIDTEPAAPDVSQPFVEIEDKATLDALSPAPDWADDPRDHLPDPHK